MLTPRLTAASGNGNALASPAQPDLIRPRHATPLPRPHTHQGPAPSDAVLYALPCPRICHTPGYHTSLA